MSFRLSAIVVAGLEEGPLVTSSIWLVVDPSYLVSIALVLWMLLDATLCRQLYLVLPGT